MINFTIIKEHILRFLSFCLLYLFYILVGEIWFTALYIHENWINLGGIIITAVILVPLYTLIGEFLSAEEVHCHHKLPRHMGGTDEFSNLVIIHENVHRLIHATNERAIERYMNSLQLDGKQLKKLNQLRKVCNLVALV